MNLPEILSAIESLFEETDDLATRVEAVNSIRAAVHEVSPFRSEPVDFQRGEVEWEKDNLYFNQWDWEIEVTPIKM